MTTTKHPDAAEFASVLIGHAKGLAHDEATELLSKAVEAVKDTGKDATVSVELRISRVKKIPNAIHLEAKVTGKIPRELTTSMWFADDHNGLHRNDPQQMSMWDEADGKTAAAGKD